MLDLFLFLIIALLIGMIVWLLYEAKQERKSLLENFTLDKNKLINALVARKPEEYRDLTLADKVVLPQAPLEQQPPDMVPLDQLNEEDFDKMIENQIANA